jgi:hypothetical protein
MNKEEESLKENFPVGCEVKLIDNTGMSAPLGSIGTVKGYIESTYWYLDITWKTSDPKWEQSNGGYSSYHFEVVGQMEKPQIKKSSEWNLVCQRCGAPAYQGMFKVECSKGCKC